MGVKAYTSYTCDRCLWTNTTAGYKQGAPTNWRLVRITRTGDTTPKNYWYCQACALKLEDFHKGVYNPAEDSVNKLTPYQLNRPE